MPERLDQIESALSALAKRQDRFQRQLEAIGQRQGQGALELRTAISDTVPMIGDLAQQ